MLRFLKQKPAKLTLLALCCSLAGEADSGVSELQLGCLLGSDDMLDLVQVEVALPHCLCELTSKHVDLVDALPHFLCDQSGVPHTDDGVHVGSRLAPDSHSLLKEKGLLSSELSPNLHQAKVNLASLDSVYRLSISLEVLALDPLSCLRDVFQATVSSRLDSKNRRALPVGTR